MYIPEVQFGNVTTMEPIILSSIPSDRFHKNCYICEDRGKEAKAKIGACMQCNKSGCKHYFHVTCGQAEGKKIIHFKIIIILRSSKNSNIFIKLT